MIEDCCKVPAPAVPSRDDETSCRRRDLCREGLRKGASKMQWDDPRASGRPKSGAALTRLDHERAARREERAGSTRYRRPRRPRRLQPLGLDLFWCVGA